MRRLLIAAAFILSACSSVSPARVLPDKQPSVAERYAAKPLHEIAAAIRSGEVTSLEMTTEYLDRIQEIDRAGPTLQSVLAVNPEALSDARTLDSLAKIGQYRGPLHGVPILIKDNIETLDRLPTTAGSLALRKNLTERDAPLVAGLRAQGAVILGKTNLSEWANFRSEESISGWSGLGGQTRNPHVLDRSPCGSSSGSGAATAAYLAAGSVGTETNGSIICPSAMNGIVGFKPTVGHISQQYIIPISPTQDTAGPMVRSVRDAALLMNAMSTLTEKPDYAAGLSAEALQGKRLGVLKSAIGDNPEIIALFEEAKTVLEAAGAELVIIEKLDTPDSLWGDEYQVLLTEFKASLNDYLAGASDAVESRSLAHLMAFNDLNAARELALFDQDIFEKSKETKGLQDSVYVEARDNILKAMREDGIDALLEENEVDLLISPTLSPAFLIDPVHGDSFNGGVGAGWAAAIAGYPHLTVPMGTVRRLPVGLSFIGSADDDAAILAAGYAYEQRSNKITAPEFLATVGKDEDIAEAMGKFSAGR